VKCNVITFRFEFRSSDFGTFWQLLKGLVYA